MRTLILAALAALFSVNLALAADPSCAARAAEKKLAGAAKASFIKKCAKDAGAASPAAAACEAKAAGKKLAGAARNSFMKKCEKDAMAGK